MKSSGLLHWNSNLWSANEYNSFHAESLTIYLILAFRSPPASPFEEVGGVRLWHEDLPQRTFDDDEEE